MLPTTAISSHVHPLLTEVHERLEAYYSKRLCRVVLFGSYARGDAHEKSDLDVLVVLHGPVKQLPELKVLSYLAYELTEAYGVALQLLPFSETDYWNLANPLMQNVHQEGIVL